MEDDNAMETPKYPCATLRTYPTPEFWRPNRCTTDDICFSCIRKPETNFILRGLCVKSIDLTYFLWNNSTDPAENNYFFRYIVQICIHFFAKYS